MRDDPARIDRIVTVLRDAWQRDPGFRLGQLVFNVCDASDPCAAVFFMSDEEIEKRLKSWATAQRVILRPSPNTPDAPGDSC